MSNEPFRLFKSVLKPLNYKTSCDEKNQRRKKKKPNLKTLKVEAPFCTRKPKLNLGLEANDQMENKEGKLKENNRGDK